MDSVPPPSREMTRRSFVARSALLPFVWASLSGCSSGDGKDGKGRVAHRCPSWPVSPLSPGTPLWPVRFKGYGASLSLSGRWLAGGGKDQKLWLRDARTGRLVWDRAAERSATPGDGAEHQDNPQVLAVKGRVLAGGRDGYLADQAVALCAADGKVLWRRDIPGGQSMEIAVSGDVVGIIAQHDVFGLSLRTGEVLWRLVVSQAAGLVSHGRMFLFTCRDVESPYGAMGVDRESGDVVWDERVADSNYVDIKVADGLAHLLATRVVEEAQDDGTIVFATVPGEVRSIDAETGKVAWNRSMPLSGDWLIGGGCVFVQTNDRLFALLRDTGETAWSMPIPSDTNVQLAFHEGSLFASRSGFADEKGFLIALDPATGKERWRLDDSDFSPVIPGPPGMLLANPDGGTVSALETTAGDVIWSSRFKGPVQAVTDELVYCHDGEEISVYDVTSGDPYYGQG
ncbi:PQQ-binding-like beta-propeller repeat protein [Streptomyces sp. SID9913]|uniref:outer membrane protein assembly factor BamB family protein n=1 Tax=Streptomyces sp. SID9913 TaxID=2706117 RepID=UPI001EF18E50|nr:PQQ-binding-like beta-propeller repeat protein [Streptomyces sp. SID9913]